MNEEMSLPTKVACFGLVAGVVICFWQLSRSSLTTRETIFFSSALAILSIAASWFLSKYYSEQSYTRNLQVFGRKASEKVNNLSTELNKLVAFLQQELEPDETLSSTEDLLSKRMRIEATIHMVGTLKSINEGTLSDWQAVIGDEIVEQKEKQEEKEETLRDILEMMKTLPPNESSTEKNTRGEGNEELLRRVDSIRSEMRMLATQVSGVPIKDGGLKKRKERIEKKCPNCDKALIYFQKTRPNSTKAFNCSHCGIPLISREIGGTFKLTDRAPVDEKLECPNCNSGLSFALDPNPGSSIDLECNHCKAALRATRRANVIRLRYLDKDAKDGQPMQLSDELLFRVKDEMGKQPWATGKSREVANRLKIPHTTVSRAIQVLVSRGEFMLQHNGRLYSPVEAGKSQR
jgi:predicted RNA-binding Zn-ribbon protein involved in translation (DUF1610 family)